MSRDRSTTEYLTNKKTKRGDVDTIGWRRERERERGRQRLLQHPATVDLKYGHLCCCSVGRGCLMCCCHGNCWSQCWHPFLEDHSSPRPAARCSALSTHPRCHDCSGCYFWLLLAISVVCCFVFVHFVFSFCLFFLPTSAAFHLSSLSVIEAH